ncbi:endonuclease domain-containing protein [Pontibacter anaerobius]|uniref:Endonuclease domain-containing protein n=1 Tax=Pontibacter anaerobius TaxID=2993940 RepID=A0ABT3R9F7_9BACT|nr:endonuclease domain-containing protein [Pontibacter anaerobius]
MAIHNRRYLTEHRRELRSSLTPAEAELWKHLKSGNLNGKKFRRQHSVENYILDFYYPSEQLAVELDGQVHNSIVAEHADRERDRHLSNLNIRVLRFENRDVFENLEAVLQEISSNFKR